MLGKVLNQYRPMTDQSLIRLWDLWEQAVGEGIAANARPAAFKGDILLVHVSSSTWLHHLRYLESEIIDKLNQALGADQVKKIQLKIGPVQGGK